MNESETIEFKKSLAELGEGVNSLAAILNKHGAGELWFGIKNDSTPVGMEVTETTLRKVSQAIAAHIELQRGERSDLAELAANVL